MGGYSRDPVCFVGEAESPPTLFIFPTGPLAWQAQQGFLDKTEAGSDFQDVSWGGYSRDPVCFVGEAESPPTLFILPTGLLPGRPNDASPTRPRRESRSCLWAGHAGHCERAPMAL